jgi:single-strand DNA-binding protein
MFGKIIVCGRLTAPPELRYSAEGKAYCSFTVAVDRRSFGSEKKTDFFYTTAFGKQAENCANYLDKGKLALVDGTPIIDQYEGNDGSKKQNFKILADTVKFLSPRETRQSDFVGGEIELPDDDLPF